MRIVARVRDDDLRRKLEQVATELETEILFIGADTSGPAGLLPQDVFVIELDSNSATTALGPVNFIGQDVPSLGTNWSVETQLTVNYTGGWQHAGLKQPNPPLILGSQTARLLFHERAGSRTAPRMPVTKVEAE